MLLPYLFVVVLFIGCTTQPSAPTMSPAPLPTGTIQDWNEHGTANTPTAKDALQISSAVRVVRFPDKHLELSVDVTTSNGALTDNGTGCVRTALIESEREVSSFVTCSDLNPGRGWPWSSNTVRHGHADHQIPNGIVFNKIGFKFFNSLHQGEPSFWNSLVTIGTTVTAGL